MWFFFLHLCFSCCDKCVKLPIGQPALYYHMRLWLTCYCPAMWHTCPARIHNGWLAALNPRPVRWWIFCQSTNEIRIWWSLQHHLQIRHQIFNRPCFFCLQQVEEGTVLCQHFRAELCYARLSGNVNSVALGNNVQPSVSHLCCSVVPVGLGWSYKANVAVILMHSTGERKKKKLQCV